MQTQGIKVRSAEKFKKSANGDEPYRYKGNNSVQVADRRQNEPGLRSVIVRRSEEAGKGAGGQAKSELKTPMSVIDDLAKKRLWHYPSTQTILTRARNEVFRSRELK